LEDALLEEVELLCLDAGNTVVFLDHARVARVVERLGHEVAVDALVRCEGEGKRAIEHGTQVRVAWSGAEVPGWAQWGGVAATMLARAGVPERALAEILEVLKAEHVELNLWSRVPEGLTDALGRVRAAGVKVAIVSNSEGTLDKLFERLGIASAFDFVIDSAVVGVEKPDPRIFAIALDRAGVTAARALHLGDTFATDVLGARRAGLRVALIDPFGHYVGLHPDVPRVSGAVEVARTLAERARRPA
jgi:HAD superfamily hydrolase (TIGR01509 family)